MWLVIGLINKLFHETKKTNSKVSVDDPNNKSLFGVSFRLVLNKIHYFDMSYSIKVGHVFVLIFEYLTNKLSGFQVSEDTAN